jgi:hypothetical protein
MRSSNSGRREFLRCALSGAVGLVAARTARAANGRIDILLNEPIGIIAPEIYGHFIEHLGGVVYDGIWVGEKSKVPNIKGIRKELVDRMQPIKPAVIRWPGGCFADSYNWRDGVGPRAQRPRRTNFWYGEVEGNGPQKYDPNEFGIMNLPTLHSSSNPSLIWLQTFEASPRTTSMNGSSIAIHLPAPLHWRTFEGLSPFRFGTGALEMNRGAVAATSLVRSMRSNFGALLLGFHSTETKNFAISLRGQMVAI